MSQCFKAGKRHGQVSVHKTKYNAAEFYETLNRTKRFIDNADGRLLYD